MTDDTTTTEQPAAQTAESATTVVCGRCKRAVSTKQKGTRRVYSTHGPDPNGSFFCGNSGSPVPK